MIKKPINKTHIEGYVYEHDLKLKVTGPNTKAPGTQFINGELKVATDEACTNIISVFFTYVTATTAKGSPNATFTALQTIINGERGCVMTVGKEKAAKVRIDSAIGLNEWYDKSNNDALVSNKRNEGGFVHFCDVLNSNEAERSTFACDMLITGANRVDANEAYGTPEKVVLKGYIFDFRGSFLPIELPVHKTEGMDYFESLEPSSSNPYIFNVWGTQLSTTVKKSVNEETLFGGPYVKETSTSFKDFVVEFAKDPGYTFGEDGTITLEDVKKGLADREVYLAGIKARRDEYEANKARAAAAPATPAPSSSNNGFNF
jgi:hypothetical protein